MASCIDLAAIGGGKLSVHAVLHCLVRCADGNSLRCYCAEYECCPNKLWQSHDITMSYSRQELEESMNRIRNSIKDSSGIVQLDFDCIKEANIEDVDKTCEILSKCDARKLKSAFVKFKNMT